MMPCAMTMSVQVCEAIAKTGMPVAAVQAMVPQPPLRKRERGHPAHALRELCCLLT